VIREYEYQASLPPHVQIPERFAAYLAERCMVCDTASILMLEREKAERYMAGAHVQTVWPEMPAPQRELIISGTHPHCWEQLPGDR
jgi:hypothetical protein